MFGLLGCQSVQLRREFSFLCKQIAELFFEIEVMCTCLSFVPEHLGVHIPESLLKLCILLHQFRHSLFLLTPQLSIINQSSNHPIHVPSQFSMLLDPSVGPCNSATLQFLHLV